MITKNDLIMKKVLSETPHKIVSVCDLASSKIECGKILNIIISRKCNKIFADLVINPIIMFELNDTDLEFDYTRIFNSICVMIGGILIDKLYQNQISIYLANYDLQVVRDKQKVYFPVPIQCMLNGIFGSKCEYHNINLLLEFSKNNIVNYIADIKIQSDLIFFQTQPNLTKVFLSAMFNHYEICELRLTQQPKINYKKILQDIKKNYVGRFTNTIYQNQSVTINNLLSMGGDFFVMNIYLFHMIKKIYLYFEEKNTNVIYKGKGFEHMKFIANKCNILNMSWDELVFESNLANPNLPKGIYQIEWKSEYNDVYKDKSLFYGDDLVVKLDEICIPSSDINLIICAQSINSILYVADMAGLEFYN